MKTNNKAPLAITMGEPAGIGPEIIASLWRNRQQNSIPDFLYVGSIAALSSVAPSLPVEIVTNADQVGQIFQTALPVLHVETVTDPIPGLMDPKNSTAVIRSIETACTMALSGEVSAIVTGPINKAALYSAGFDAPGHTEYLARLCGKPDDFSVMMLTSRNLRVVPVTVHVPLKEVASTLTADKIIHAGMVTYHDLKDRFGIDNPRLAIAGLNPHAGEAGTIGMEEATHIMPAVWALRDHGIDVTDPLPADTLFHEEARAKYDAVLCMYHDQALIPVKMLDFWGGVNVTLGLPIIRTSPDHGTACEIAGKGIARADSMIAAVKLAAHLANRANGLEK